MRAPPDPEDKAKPAGDTSVRARKGPAPIGAPVFLPGVVVTLAFIFSLVLAGCGGHDSESVGATPALTEADEVPLIESEPDPDDGPFVWTAAYEVGDLPPINVGHPTADFMTAAHRDVSEAEDLVCVGAGGGGGCGFANEDPSDPRPDITGITFGGLDVKAWAWVGVPDLAVSVQFTDQDGVATWQRPVDHLVIFPDTIDDNRDAECPGCRLDAMDANGFIVASVDLESSAYYTD